VGHAGDGKPNPPCADEVNGMKKQTDLGIMQAWNTGHIRGGSSHLAGSSSSHCKGVKCSDG
jgi:hypothetical protein